MLFDRFGHRKDVVKGTVTILAISVLQPVTNFLLLPVFTHFFDSESYGYFSILNNISLFFTIISGLNIASAIAAHYKKFSTEEELKAFIGNTITFSFLFNTALLLLFCLFSNGFTHLIFKTDISFFPDVFLAIAIGLYSNIFVIYTYYLRYDKRIKPFTIFSVVQVFVIVGLQLGFLYFSQLGVTGVMVARAISAVIMLILVVIVHRQYTFKPLNFARNLKAPLTYSIMTGPALLIVWLTTYGDRFVMEHFLDLKSVGEYSFLITICSVAELAIFALNSAFQPYIFDHFATKKEHAANYYEIFMLLSIAGISVLVVLCSNIDLLIKNKEFLTTLPLTIPMLAAFVFSAISNLYALQITFAQKGSYYLTLSVIVLIANIALNFLLIPGNGIYGAVAANIVTKLIMTLSVLFFAQKAFAVDTLRKTGIIVAAFMLIEYFSWAAAKFDIINFRSAGFLQLVLLAITATLVYKKKIFTFLKLT